MEQAVAIGPVRFRFSSVEHRRISLRDARPFTRLTDGTEVLSAIECGRLYLVIDHREDPEAPSRVEFWRSETSPELPLEGLYALCDASPASVVTQSA